MRYHSPSASLGFTLVEVLVVISIIAVLAGILIPTIGMVKRQARTVQCQNNLKQIGTVIAGYQQESNNRYPISLTLLSDLPAAGKQTNDLPHKTLLCPFDTTKGADQNIGRSPSWGTPIELFETGCSYIFEIGRRPLGNVGGWGDIARYGGTTYAWTNYYTWDDAKVVQLKYGNKGSARTTTDQWGPYLPQQFPVVRCFHHAQWKGAVGSSDQPKKVLNLTFDYSLLWSSPTWENDVVN